MANYNKVLLMGNLTRDPQLSYLPSQTPVVEFGLAVNRRFKKQDGEQGEETMFIDCRSFGRTAEVINQYFHKGEPIFIEGRLQLDQWEDKEGGKRSKHRIFVENFQFITSRAGGSAPGSGPGSSGPQSYGDGGPGPSTGGYGGGQRSSAPRPPASTAGGGGASRPAPSNNPPPVMGGDEVEDIPF
ncbi:MAG: single-stranded DNA-binding protein [Phycisphaerales bacterium]